METVQVLRTLAIQQQDYVNVTPVILVKLLRLCAIVELAKVRISYYAPTSIKIILYFSVSIYFTKLIILPNNSEIVQ